MLTCGDSPLLQDTLKILLEHLQGKGLIHQKFKAQIPPQNLGELFGQVRCMLAQKLGLIKYKPIQPLGT